MIQVNSVCRLLSTIAGFAGISAEEAVVDKAEGAVEKRAEDTFDKCSKSVHRWLNNFMPNHDREGVSKDVDPSESGATVFNLARELNSLNWVVVMAMVNAEDAEITSETETALAGVLMKKFSFIFWIWFVIIPFAIPRYCCCCSEKCSSYVALFYSAITVIGLISEMTLSFDFTFTIGVICFTFTFEICFDTMFTLFRIFLCSKDESPPDVPPPAAEWDVAESAESGEAVKQKDRQTGKGKAPAPKKVGKSGKSGSGGR